MAKYKRQVIGQVIKGKKDEGTGVVKADYIKMDQDVTLKKGQYLNLENKASQLKGIDEAEHAGKLTSEVASNIREKIEKIPDFVRFQVVLLEKQG